LFTWLVTGTSERHRPSGVGRPMWSGRPAIFVSVEVSGRSSTDITTSCMITWTVPQPKGSHWWHVEEVGGGAGLLLRSDSLLEDPLSNERAALMNNNGKLLLS
jgi:hypothetical protein